MTGAVIRAAGAKPGPRTRSGTRNATSYGPDFAPGVPSVLALMNAVVAREHNDGVREDGRDAADEPRDHGVDGQQLPEVAATSSSTGAVLSVIAERLDPARLVAHVDLVDDRPVVRRPVVSNSVGGSNGACGGASPPMTKNGCAAGDERADVVREVVGLVGP